MRLRVFLLLWALGLRASTWSNAGDKLAYSHDGKLWLADLVSGKNRPLGRVSVADNCKLLWQPSGTSILLACPDSLTSVETGAGRVRRLLASASRLADTTYSTDGAFITFVRDHNLWQMPGSGGPCRQLTERGNETLLIGEPDPVFAHEFPVQSDYWWAPDSSAIAYMETDTSQSGAYPIAGKSLPVMKLKLLSLANGNEIEIAAGTPDRPYIANIAWLPDSKRLAFHTLNRLQNQLDLNVYDPASPSYRQVFTEKDPYWINLPEAPVFTNNGEQFLITSERTGYRHIYLYGVDGHLERDLTPGKVEVSRPLTVDSRHALTYYSALTGNMRELHLYRVGLDGSAPQQITKEPGWHETQIDPTAGAFVDSSSTADRPPSAAIRRMDGSKIVTLSSAAAVSPPKAEFFEVKTHDNVPLPAMMWKPPDFDPQKKYPVILFTLSGPQGHVVKNAWGGWQNVWNRAMAAKGYVVVAVDVRGSGGYGHYFEEYIHYRLGAQETADLREVFSYLSRLTYVDSKRIGIWGCDYGGHIAVHAMLEFPHGFKAGFADSPITDWTLYNAYFSERYLGLPKGRYNEYHDSSALDNARRLEGKLTVAYSPANSFIQLDQITGLTKALDKVNKHIEAVVFPNANYHEDAASLATLMKSMTDFFSNNL